ncbi:MAG TPA: CGNR zinc finger domain-containing protein [Nocardioides sp.]|uniref:CGNR zinc finger domain-containing protein n=1 Tax=Nocardioides sp. TaxID=35761 RepID=UPI002CF6717D|nr:CGNR zinc finger domain-containing protein [Nocardioides sp.]HQR28017.1 CGNR zinc finger domain-containing protein [Nocardioides sp.]
MFTHDTRSALAAAVALANSAERPDTLTSVAELDRFFAEHRYSGRHDRTPEELESVRALRPALRALLTADRDTAVETVNRMLAEAGACPRLVRHDGWDWHLHVVARDRPLATRITVETAMAVIDLIRADELSRLSVCEADGCVGVVVDLSRNRSRRFCSTACGNRTAVAAYRARRAGAAGGADRPDP